MVDLYRRHDGPPAPLPTVAYTDDGFSRTDLANQPDSREELDFVFFATIDPSTQRVIKRGDAYVVETQPPEPIQVSADVVTMRQARLALLAAGKLDAADDAIEALEGQEGAAARIEWDYATTIRRDHPLVTALGSELGLDDEAIDSLFAQAAQIP